MGEKRLSSEQIIVMLREAEVLESKRLVQIRKALKVHGPNLGKLTEQYNQTATITNFSLVRLE